MIEKTLLVEQEFGSSVLVTLDHVGELGFICGSDEGIRAVSKDWSLPTPYWYRCSGNDVHAAANGTPKWRMPAHPYTQNRNLERVKKFANKLKAGGKA